MAENDAQEKTEEATPKRKSDAKEKGQIARSRELNTLLVLLAGSGGLYMLGGNITSGLKDLMTASFIIQRDEIFSTAVMISRVFYAIDQAINILVPFFLLVVIAALFSPMALGGFIFSPKSMMPKLEKISLIKGMKRMFSLKALMELLKAMAKFFLIGAVVIGVLYLRAFEFMELSKYSIEHGLFEAGRLIIGSFIIISFALVVIAFVDVPYQLFDHNKKMRMSKQEVKDEFKDTEGKPEVKRKIRELQQKLAKNRMMQEVPKADVVITNPTHFSIAIQYEPGQANAPIVVAKGVDLMAQQIRKVAKHHNIPLLEAPPLARALYYTTDLNQPIPTELYIAVAQVLAYVYQLKSFEDGSGVKPQPPTDLPIPDEMIY